MDPDIILHYYATPLYLNHYEKSGKSGGYIKLPFQHPRSLVEPNLISYPELDKFKTTNLYIFKRSMNLGIHYDAELVLEHISATNNGGSPVYVVFLLQKSPKSTWTEVDDILAATNTQTPCSLDLDKIAAQAIRVPGNNCLTNVNGTVYVLASAPIAISDKHDLSLLSVTNDLLVSQAFTAENAIACRAISFRDAMGGLLTGTTTTSTTGSQNIEGFKEGATGYKYVVNDDDTNEPSHKVDENAPSFTADVDSVNMGKISMDGTSVKVPSLIHGNIDLSQMELDCQQVDGNYKIGSGVEVVKTYPSINYKKYMFSLMWVWWVVFGVVYLIYYKVIDIFKSNYTAVLDMQSNRYIPYLLRFGLIILCIISIILMEINNKQTFVAGFYILIIVAISYGAIYAVEYTHGISEYIQFIDQWIQYNGFDAPLNVWSWIQILALIMHILIFLTITLVLPLVAVYSK